MNARTVLLLVVVISVLDAGGVQLDDRRLLPCRGKNFGRRCRPRLGAPPRLHLRRIRGLRGRAAGRSVRRQRAQDRLQRVGARRRRGETERQLGTADREPDESARPLP